MMDNILYPNHRYHQKRKTSGNRSHRNSILPVIDRTKIQKIINSILMAAIVLMACYLAVFFVYHTAVKPFLYVNNIEIRFQEKLDIDQQDILAVTGLSRPVRFLDIDEDLTSELILKSFPYVKEVQVAKIFPATVMISIWGRKPVCVSLYDTGSVSVPFAVDTEGRIFELGTAVKEFDLPVLSGVKISSLELNGQIPVLYIPVLEDLSLLKEKQPELYARISEIAVDEKNGKGYDLYVYFRMYELPVKMGSRLDLTEIEAAVQVLDLLESSGLSGLYSMLDFRSSKPVLKKK